MLRRGALIVLSVLSVTWHVAHCLAELPPLIPRTVLFGNPDKSTPRISPDGKLLAYLAPDDGVMNVWVRTMRRHDDRVVTHDRGRGIQIYFWAPASDKILYLQDESGDGNWHLFSVGLKDSSARDLTPFPGIRVNIVAVESGVPDEILIAMNRRDPKVHDVYRLNLATGELTLESENKGGYLGWVADGKLRLRIATRLTKDGGVRLDVLDEPASDWRELISWSAEDVFNSGGISFTRDNEQLYILSSKGTNTSQLRTLDIASGTERVIASNPRADVASLFIHPTKKTVQAVGFMRQHLRWKVLDKSIKRDFRKIKRIRRGDFTVIHRDDADATWLVSFTTDDGPIYYYAYDRVSRKPELLFSSRKALEGLSLAKMVPIWFDARDGLSIPGYLTKPPGVPATRLPMVVYVHGGPWARDSWRYDGVVQWLANRGYAVLQINYRGSTGYGKKFINAADREWGGKMQTDLLDGVRWAVQRGIADRNRVAIYGGYPALCGVTFTPKRFRCAVAVSATADLVAFMENIPPYMKSIEPLLFDRIGHPVKDAAFLHSRSPLYHVDKIVAPLLIGQGANNRWIHKSDTIKFIDALREAGKNVQYVEYANEGQGFVHPENRLDFYAKAEKFLAKHLGGRYEE